MVTFEVLRFECLFGNSVVLWLLLVLWWSAYDCFDFVWCLRVVVVFAWLFATLV